VTRTAPVARPRGLGDAFAGAFPDALAALACARSRFVRFSIRTLRHFDDTHDTAPLPTVEDDAVPREVIETVEGRAPPRARRRRGR
jgi:hypothetical protein